MERFTIYLVGGMSKYGSDNFDEGNKWRIDLKYALEHICCNYKVHVINPNDYYNFLNKDYDTDKEVMDFDLHKVKHSNLCIVNFNDTTSLGSMAEIATAYDNRIPIVGLCENDELSYLHPWQREMCLKMFTDREDLLCYVINYFLD